MIHLRIRTEYSFKKVYGPIASCVQRLQEVGTKAAGIVDTSGTWGHVEWEQECQKAGIQPMFGREWQLKDEPHRLIAPIPVTKTVWGLATDLKEFYKTSSEPPKELGQWAEVKGVIRFAGWWLTDPESFDYVDLNPRSIRSCLRALKKSKATGRPLVITADNSFPSEADRNRYLAWNDGKQMTTQTIPTKKELEALFPFLTPDQIKECWHSAEEIAERTAKLTLNKSPPITFGSDQRLHELIDAGKSMRLARKHIQEWTSEYQERLEKEVELIIEKGFRSYFLVVSDLIVWAKQRMLVGPARGSSAGSLVCYLLEITEVDPLVHGLIFERFISHERFDMPDIDVDFNDEKRHLVFEYLEELYGKEYVARIGSVNRLKARSVINHVTKRMGIPIGAGLKVANVLLEYSSGDSRYGKGLEDTLNGTQPGLDFLHRYPEAEVMKELELHASHTGQHAAGIIVSNFPITDYCTVEQGIAQLDKVGAEYLGLLKMDILGLRTLGVLDDCAVLSPQQFYDLPLDDEKVFELFREGKFSGIFQFEGAAQRKVAGQVPVRSFKEIDHVTALARPGPLIGGSTEEYVARNKGVAAIAYHHPTMKEYLHETKGVVLYQEQVMRIVRELGKFSWKETSTIRKAMSGRKGKEFFDKQKVEFQKGAAQSGVDSEIAEQIWHELCNFGAWGMNKSHTVSYAIISYWCGWMKVYHQAEFAAALLRNAKDDVQVLETLRELTAEGIKWVPFCPEKSQASWSVQGGVLYGGFDNLVGCGPVKAANLARLRDSGTVKAGSKEFTKRELKFESLTPIKDAWGHFYTDPSALNVKGKIKEFAELEDRTNVVVIAALTGQRRRDENEALLVGKRGYEVKGQTQFLDCFMVDDSVSKHVTVRFKPAHWESIGQKLADRAEKGDVFLVRGYWLAQFSMLLGEKVRCLTNPGLFD